MDKTTVTKNAKESGVLYRMTLVAAVLQPLMTVPQAVQLYSTQDAQGLSLLTWLGYTMFGLIFLAYSIQFRLKPIILQQSLWFVLQSSVVIGIVIWS
ncbi:hypothetical protein KC953_03705 [Candidatus Saccharibacteria bacterium]|nr:hypothetical protein [Candidatus Saccharibacteria bacterium]